MVAPTRSDAGVEVQGIDPADALQILEPNPDKTAWLRMRRTGLGGSDASALVGLNRWTSKRELWEDKTGRLPLDDEQSEPAEMGVLLEPVVRDRFARVNRVTVDPCGMLRSQRWPWMTANPDGLILADQHGYEGKTCNQWLAHEWGSPDDPLIPDHAELQAQWCMAVTGWSGWWVACLIGGQSNVYRFVHRDDVLIDSLVQVSYQFWTHNVLGNVAPDIDGSSALVDELKSRYPLADPDTEVQLSVDDFDLLAMLREKAKQAVKDAKEDDEAVKNRVREFLGSKERLMCGELQIASWKHTKRFAEKKFRDAHPDIAAQYATTVPAVDVERLAKEKPALYREFCSRELRFND